MSKGGLITLLGFLILITPFLGIPSVAKVAIAVLIGLALMALGFLTREEKKWMLRALYGNAEADAYTENSARVETHYAKKVPEHSA